MSRRWTCGSWTFPGLWQHFTIPVSKLDEDTFEDGLGFDGSSIRGWQAINESDMLVVPQPETALDRSVHRAADAGDDLQHSGPDHARGLLARPAQRGPQGGQLPEEHGHRRHGFIGPEAEFFIFDDVRFDQNAHEGFYYIDSIEGEWNRGRDEKPNLGYKLRYKEGYFPVPPADQLMDIRNEMMQTMIECGWTSKPSTTKWPRPASRKSTCGSRSW
jgi:glutamine synthetase